MGKPYGLKIVEAQSAKSYKIVTDAYHKRYSIEKYQQGQFETVIYDSSLLDFRHLKPVDQLAWNRECLKEDNQSAVYILRNQDDRAILIETQLFEKNWCRSCEIRSVHGIPLSTHQMFYQAFGDPFDGVILYDIENHPVMKKTYAIDSITKEFSQLLTEEWDMEKESLLSQSIKI